MAATYTPQIGLGGKLEIDTAYPGTPAWSEIGDLTDVDFSFDVGEADVSHTQIGPSPTYGDPPYYSDWLPGKISVEMTFGVVFDPGALEHEDAILDHVGIVRQFRYTWPDGTQWTWVGFYRSIPVSIPLEDKAAASITCRLTGHPTFTAHA